MAPYGGIELGGTKCVLAVGDGAEGVWADTVIATTDPGTTLEAALDWFRDVQKSSGAVASVGIASFGPLDLESGEITGATPKTAWRGCQLRSWFEEGLGVSAPLDTDVNAAALAESAWGAAQACSDMIYVTVGTGIGVGTIVNGSVVHGRSHPEAGHMRIPQHATDCQPGMPGQPWAGNCVTHGNCWEGLASGTARARRTELWAEHSMQAPDAQMLESEYLALGLVNLIASYRPERVVVGGGVMHEEGLLTRTRSRAGELLDPAYFPEANDMDDLVVAPGLGDAAGVSGAILLAAQLMGADLKRHSMARLASQIRTGP